MFVLVQKFGGPEEVLETDTPPSMLAPNNPYCRIGPAKERREDLLILDDPCCECSGIISALYSCKERLIRDKVCFSCDYWRGVVSSYEDGNILIMYWQGEFHSFEVGPEDVKRRFRGFGGRRFDIHRFDGPKAERIKTTNLWHQGQVPRHFLDRLPRNAEIL